MTTSNLSQYDQQATDFLTKFGLSIRITLSDSKTPSWGEGAKHGHHYRVTLSRKSVGGRMTFDFWGSVSDMEKHKEPSAYDVLSCISSDVHTPETFEDFCGDYGYDSDSIESLQNFRRCDRFAKRLRAFFTMAEIEALQEIN